MADQKTHNEKMTGDAANSSNRSGDPGRTPSKAEGDRETVEQDLRHKERQRQLDDKQ